MHLKPVLLRIFSALMLVLLSTHIAFAQSTFSQPTSVDFSTDYERIFQIQVVSKDAGGKSSIGSAFQVSGTGLIMTNFHVVSEFVSAPEQYQIKYVTHDGQTGQLELLDFDVVSDLAVLQHPAPSEPFFNLSNTVPEKGEMTYALGNPGDWGIVMVPGPANGFVEHHYENRILFSGSLNPGMSGGPSLNKHGHVIGVNVATAGSQLSFLVPANKAKSLMDRERKLKPAAYNEEIKAQIIAWQRPRIAELLNRPWQSEEFLDKTLFGEIRSDFQCWGDTNESDKERIVEYVKKACKAGDDIYINSDLSTGQIRFSFYDLKPVKLNAMQFARAQSRYMGADNRSTYDNSTNYKCQTDFIEAPDDNSKGYHRIISCIRAYRKLTGLYDSLLLVLNNSGSAVFKSHLSLSGLQMDQIQSMNRLFVERSL